MSDSLITPKALSIRMGLPADGKALRRFMRKLADNATMEGGTPIVPRCGQGNRYGMRASDALRIENAWRKAHGLAPKASPKAKASKAKAAPAATPATPADAAPDSTPADA